ncbi:MAG: hypothetical protein JSS77_15975 [Acidobacteria bacterium]|nr:hypothetical protein [Acidobacteriota bacterium]
MIYPNLEAYDRIAIDTETTGLDWKRDSIFAISLSTPDGHDYYYDLRRNPEALDWARAEFRHIRKPVGFNLKFDAHFLRRAGVELDLRMSEDAAVHAAILNEHEDSYTLEALAAKYTDQRKLTSIYEELAAIFGGKADKKQMSNLHLAPYELVERYAKADTRATLALRDALRPKLVAEELTRIADLEDRLMPVLLNMEHRGVRVDLDLADRNYKKLTGLIEQRRAKLFAEVGREFNVNSAPQLIEILKPEKREDGYWYLPDGTFVPLTKGGRPSMSGKDVLIKSTMPVARLVMKLKVAQKTRDTLLGGHVIGSAFNGRIHTTFNQTRMADEGEDEYGTGSGRLSSNGPNVQQISKRDPEMGALVRSCFLPEEGHAWSCADWSQMDFRIATHYLRNPAIDKMYLLDPMSDFHQIVADMTGLPRKATPGIKGDAKSINLGLMFGMGKGKMAAEMGLPYTEVFRTDGSSWKKSGPEGEALFAKYHSSVRGVKALLDEMESVAKSRGFVRTGFGRRIRFPGGVKAYKAGAMIFQGTAADALKLKLIEVDSELEGTGAHLLLNVHDEFDSSLPNAAKDALAGKIRKRIECFDGVKCPLFLRTPIRSSGTLAANWWDASKD